MSDPYASPTTSEPPAKLTPCERCHGTGWNHPAITPTLGDFAAMVFVVLACLLAAYGVACLLEDVGLVRKVSRPSVTWELAI